MFTEKQSMLYHAPAMLNKPELPWVVTVEGDSIVARWKWMDAIFFSPHEVSDEVRSYYFTVTLRDNGTYREVDQSEEKTKGVSFEGGNLTFGSSTSTFKGKKNEKSFQFGLGANKQNGLVGFVGFKYDTTQVKQYLRSWLESNGWKKAGLFG